MNAGLSDGPRLREMFAARSEHARPTAGCPSAEGIWAAVRGEVSRRMARKIARHAISCPACTEAWRLARDVSEEAFSDEILSETARRPRRWAFAAAAAAAMVVIGVTVFQFSFRENRSTPTYRSDASGVLESLIPSESAVPRSGFVLKWSGLEGARYDVVVGNEDLRPLAEARSLETAQYRVSPEALAGLPGGARVLWRVVAELPDGRRVSSQTFANEVE
jgi:hypothetical protein